MEPPAELVRRLQAAGRVVAVTGAGLSVPSGIPSLIGSPAEAKWTADAFVADVQGAWQAVLDRRALAQRATPNAAHLSLHGLGAWLVGRGGRFVLATQNQDRLHAQQAAGYPVVELHGNVFQGRCPSCEQVFELPASLPPPQNDEVPAYFVCPACGAMARPAVSWFGEPYRPGTIEVAGAAAAECDVLLLLGTTGNALAVRWLLHEAHWRGGYTAVGGLGTASWRTRDGTPGWPGAPILDAVLEGDILDVMASLQAAVGWP